MTLEETIRHCEEVAYECRREQNYFLEPRDKEDIFRGVDFEDLAQNACDMAEYYEQLAEWLRELQRYRFEISECKAILDNPTPDVTENDKKRAMFVLQTFPDVRGDEI
jgi:hypothetical protein